MNFDNLFKDLITSYKPSTTVSLTGSQGLNLASIISVGQGKSNVTLDITDKFRERFEKVREKKLEQVSSGVPIYGTTTSYGGRASVILNKGNEEKRNENAAKLSQSIVHVDVSTGPAIPKEIVRAAMLIRINMLMPGLSGIRIKVLEVIKELLNKNITPIVGQYGSVGASGDLAQNGRIVSCLLHLPSVMGVDKKGKISKAQILLKKNGVLPIILEPKEGLALVNGDNFSSAAATFISYETLQLMLLNLYCNALTIQALQGSMRNFHSILSKVRPHKGQEFTSNLLRNLLQGSKLARQDLKEPGIRGEDELIQDPYSIRCLPQYFGPDWENLASIWETITINVNSVSDNPIWTTPEYIEKGEEPYKWVSGGNFLAMHMADSIDRLRKILIHIIKLNDRHLARLVHPKFSNGLPANLSDKKAISQTTFKGLQTQMGMYDVYSSLLVSPASTAFGIHEEFNQDVTSHAFSSAILSWELLRIARYAISTNLIASCQAIDLRGGPKLLSSTTKPLYEWVRDYVPFIKKEQPLGHYVEILSDNMLKDNVVKSVLAHLEL
ncbi:hypothetical protein A2714_05470 [Candidatus Woesebacteria bacterium RIFCSPHIGHO2_01_FULL_38_9]|uniref:Phenylalanine ammonia-lyase n=1 Tax=Candidatus Woesebacteria bacterium RIFCSPHIGHO2_01_FULL_38_9 TaxID=1802492 RepID=A0A1F7Y1N0_9BACT|nr:MAG: hypothetical protein A2714_05470 [Candidatus Woesebacteria bacterium RIFCSPHIGHO2_01_FULL_38_9]